MIDCVFVFMFVECLFVNRGRLCVCVLIFVIGMFRGCGCYLLCVFDMWVGCEIL
jgi:hypothetical protein